jgi:hypothetical protein
MLYGTANEGRERGNRSGQECDSVRLDAGSAGVAANGRHGGLLAVLRGSLSHAARPDRFHGRSVAALRGERNHYAA